MKLRAPVFALAVLVFPLCLWASGWEVYERRGDSHAAQQNWSTAKDYYMRAITVAGEDAPRRLWDKYNRVFFRTMREASELAQRRKAEEDAAAAAAAAGAPAVEEGVPLDDLAPNALSAEDSETTSESVSAEAVTSGSRPLLTVNEDGYVRLLLDGAQGGRVRPAEPTGGTEATPKPTVPENTRHRPESSWGQPLAYRGDGRTSFGPDEKVGVDTVLNVSKGAGVAEGVQSVNVETPEYLVDQIRFDFRGSRRLVVSGKVHNKMKHPFHNAKVYVRLYNETGVFKGRTWSYLKPGRNSLNPGKSKSFEVKFFGYTGSVGSYKIEVVTNLRR